MQEGIYSIWKPKGPTSHDIVAMVRKRSGVKKVGHAGTLDPLAEGVLVVAVGREFTKNLDSIKQQEKEYLAEIKLGYESTTDDEEGEKAPVAFQKKPAAKKVRQILDGFVGVSKQLAPRYSSVKIRGMEAYKRARKGEAFALPPREVEIKGIDLISYEWPLLKIKVTTGPGVYIRSLARDIGRALMCGGYLAGLMRTRVGKYHRLNSLSLEKIVQPKD